MIYHSDIIRVQGNLLAEQCHHRLRVIIRHVGVIKRIEALRLLVIEQRYLQQPCLRLVHECLHGGHYRRCHALHQALAVAAIVVFDGDRGLSIIILYVESQAELRHVQLQILHLQLPATHGVAAQHAYLVGKHNLRRQVIVGCYLCKRVILMRQRGIKLLADGAQEIADRPVIDLCAQHERIDKHAHRVSRSHVGAAIADGGQRDAFAVGEGTERIEHRRQ